MEDSRIKPISSEFKHNKIATLDTIPNKERILCYHLHRRTRSITLINGELTPNYICGKLLLENSLENYIKNRGQRN